MPHGAHRMAPLVPIPSLCIVTVHRSLVIDVVALLQMQGVLWMASVAHLPFPTYETRGGLVIC